MKTQGIKPLVFDNTMCPLARLTHENRFFLPSNMTSKLQPLVHGVIKFFNALHCVIVVMHENGGAIEISKQIFVSDSLHEMTCDWRNLSQDAS
ncbi:hypothetical protein AVEN_273944-1 [Araneus ventricosus]|uniref:DDE-1 domain-containing protein n=1 Tax=Araneus ventricosus TaxID=182803 RepID=A0A4Y2HN23_ARAVE|nr:hypothetical protein AVEN_273944-1 [Araneus ventricosus]